MMRSGSLAVALLSLVVVAGCSARPQPARGALGSSEEGALPPLVNSGGDSAVAGVPADSARVARLERRARRLAHTHGCARAGDCRVAPVGVRPCGGPRDYLAYCAASTDTVALFRTLRELERAERAYNDRTHIMGSCQMLLPPTAALDGGSCGVTRTP